MKWLRRGSIGFLVSVVLAAGGYVVLQTRAGQEWAGGLAGRTLSDPGIGTVGIARLELDSWKRVRLHGVSVADREGAWTRVPEVVVDWRPLALLMDAFPIEAVTAPRIDVLRRPVMEPPTETEPGPLLPKLPRGLRAVSIDAFALHPPVLGAGATFRVRYRGAPANEAVRGGSLSVERLDRTADRIELVVQTDADGERLSLRMQGREDPDGVIARYLGFPRGAPLSLDLEGAGHPRDWSGKLSARSGRELLVEAAIGLRIVSRSEISIAAKGEIGPATLSALAIPASLRSTLRFDAEFGWREAKNEIRIRRLKFEHLAGALQLSGRVVADDALIDVDISGSIRGGDWLAGVAGPEAGFESATVEGKVAGPVNALTVRAEATVSGATAPGLTAATARATASLDGARTGPRRLRAELELTKLVFRSARAGALFGDAASLTARAEADSGFARLTGIQARLRSGGFALTVTDGSVQRGERKAALTLEATSADLSRVGAVSGLEIEGRAMSRARISIDGATVDATVSIDSEGLTFGEPALDSIIGPRPRIEAVIGRSTDEAISVRDLRLEAATFQVRGRADLRPENDRLAATVEMTAPDLFSMTSPFGTPIAGRATVKVTAGGRLSDPDLTASLQVPALSYQRRALGPLKAELTARSAVSGPTGRISAWINPPEGRIDAAFGYSLVSRSALELRDVEVRGLGAESTGSLDVSLDRRTLDGKLSGVISDLATLSGFAGRPLGGALSAEVSLGAVGGRQTIKFRATGEKIAAGDGIGARSLTCSGAFEGFMVDARMEASCTAVDLGKDDWRSERAAISIGGTLSQATARLEVSAVRPIGYRVDALARFERRDARTVVRLEKLGGEVGDQPLQLLEPLRLDLAPDALALSRARIRFGRAELSLAGELANGSVSGDARLTGAELSDYAAFTGRSDLAGRIEGTMSLRGTPDDPAAEFSVQLSRMAMNVDAPKAKPDIDGAITGRVAGGTLTVDAVLEGFAESGLRANGSIPVLFSLSPPEIRFAEDLPLRADARWRGELGPLVELFPLPGHSVSGEASVSLAVSGTVRRPIAKGSVALRKGRYENLFTGMVLTDVTVDGEGDDDRVRLRFAAGSDASAGRLEGSGMLALDGGNGYPVELAVSFTELAAVRRDDVSALLDGRFTLTGSLEDLLLRGDIETRRVEWRIGQPLPPGVVDVEVTEIGGERGDRKSRERPAPGPKRILRLELDVRMPGNVFVRGRGLDSEWRGTLKTRGSAASLAVEGKLEHLRGQFEFAGKVFKLERGIVTFLGGEEIDPDIDLRADHKARSLTASVVVTGKASRPSIALSSTPSMPRDEILSRVLFGKGVGQLSQLEAVQLGAAVASVSGLDGGGAGLVDTLRRTVGVDVLRVGSDAEGSPTAVLGKNISEDLYVGVEQGAAANSGKVQVELEILPGIKLTSGVNAETQGNIGIEFRWDY